MYSGVQWWRNYEGNMIWCRPRHRNKVSSLQLKRYILKFMVRIPFPWKRSTDIETDREITHNALKLWKVFKATFNNINKNKNFNHKNNLIMPSWLNWYSTGLENRHSEWISEFESLARRFLLSYRGIGLMVRHLNPN